MPTYWNYFEDGHVVERGYPTRPMAADEMQQLGEFRKQWEQFKPQVRSTFKLILLEMSSFIFHGTIPNIICFQFRLYIKGDVAAMPPIPAVPCFCREPCLGNAIGNTLV